MIPSCGRHRRSLFAIGIAWSLCGQLAFGAKTTGFLNAREVRAQVRLIDARTGEKLWESKGSGGSSRTAVSVSGAIQAGAQHVGTLIAEKAVHSPYLNETLDMVWNAIQYLPRKSQ